MQDTDISCWDSIHSASYNKHFVVMWNIVNALCYYVAAAASMSGRHKQAA